jgi:hypothetical protein
MEGSCALRLKREMDQARIFMAIPDPWLVDAPFLHGRERPPWRSLTRHLRRFDSMLVDLTSMMFGAVFLLLWAMIGEIAIVQR